MIQLEIGREVLIFAPVDGEEEKAEYAVQVGVGVVVIVGIAIGGWLGWSAIENGVSVTISTPAATITVDIGGGGE